MQKESHKRSHAKGVTQKETYIRQETRKRKPRQRDLYKETYTWRHKKGDLEKEPQKRRPRLPIQHICAQATSHRLIVGRVIQGKIRKETDTGIQTTTKKYTKRD